MNDLLAAPFHDGVDAAESWTRFLLRAAEFAELAESTLDEDLDDLAPEERLLLKRAKDVTFAAASAVEGGLDEDENQRVQNMLVDDTQKLADAVEGATDIETAIETADAPDWNDADTRWIKHGEFQLGTVKLDPWLYLELKTLDFDEEPTSKLELFPASRGKVKLGSELRGKRTGTPSGLVRSRSSRQTKPKAWPPRCLTPPRRHGTARVANHEH
ncbi:hypothetical protein [Halovenus salina]|uniref:Uncharacterized protein n=1 Tax=Halovenus salina TaxID=1510225 RepID=A0ABD5W8G2_9EURY